MIENFHLESNCSQLHELSGRGGVMIIMVHVYELTIPPKQ